MFLLKLLLRITLLPIIIALTLLQWAGTFLTHMSGIIINLLSFIIFLTAVLSWAFGIAPGTEVLKMFIISAVIYAVPHIMIWLVVRIAVLNTIIKEYTTVR